MHEIKVKEMSKNIEKKEMRMLIKINKDIHSEIKIKKIEWLTKENEQKRYISLMICIISAEMHRQNRETGKVNISWFLPTFPELAVNLMCQLTVEISWFSQLLAGF